MAYAVLNINVTDRPIFDGAGFCHIRRRYRAFAERLRGSRVVLYQSGRQNPGVSTGYFGTAVIEDVFDRPDDQQRCILCLSGYEALGQLRPLIGLDGMYETNLSHPSGLFSGWRAADDIREISKDDYVCILCDEISAQSVNDQSQFDEISVPKFRTRSVRDTDPNFTHSVYVAYRGRCAISGLTLLGGHMRSCGLEAAHIYPNALEPRSSVSSWILLAPSWHSRYDSGLILFHDDYTWSSVVEDADTLAIVDKRLALPLAEADWPDIALIRRNRERILSAGSRD